MSGVSFRSGQERATNAMQLAATIREIMGPDCTDHSCTMLGRLVEQLAYSESQDHVQYNDSIHCRMKTFQEMRLEPWSRIDEMLARSRHHLPKDSVSSSVPNETKREKRKRPNAEGPKLKKAETEHKLIRPSEQPIMKSVGRSNQTFPGSKHIEDKFWKPPSMWKSNMTLPPWARQVACPPPADHTERTPVQRPMVSQDTAIISPLMGCKAVPYPSRPQWIPNQPFSAWEPPKECPAIIRDDTQLYESYENEAINRQMPVSTEYQEFLSFLDSRPMLENFIFYADKMKCLLKEVKGCIQAQQVDDLHLEKVDQYIKYAETSLKYMNNCLVGALKPSPSTMRGVVSALPKINFALDVMKQKIDVLEKVNRRDSLPSLEVKPTISTVQDYKGGDALQPSKGMFVSDDWSSGSLCSDFDETSMYDFSRLDCEDFDSKPLC
mmetsp:Transcript_653/g.1108  ORF Transcript_653/g.1108 Transcript_653/m.1108 type:complete len:437 (+) Transcript_653:3-1313(+)